MLKERNSTSFLVEECKLGKEYAYKELYENYVNAMYNTANRILQNSALAEDKVQEAFVKAFQKINSIVDNASFGGWLKKIVINSCLNEVKKAKIEFVSDEVILNEHEEELDQPLAYPDLTIDNIKNSVGLLPDGYRVILNLFLFENYSHKQIAEELNITSSTSRTQFMRAKGKLKEILLENYG